MSDVPFYRTVMGQRFYDHTIPELVRQLTRLNALLERLLKTMGPDSARNEDPERE